MISRTPGSPTIPSSFSLLISARKRKLEELDLAETKREETKTKRRSTVIDYSQGTKRRREELGGFGEGETERKRRHVSALKQTLSLPDPTHGLKRHIEDSNLDGASKRSKFGFAQGKKRNRTESEENMVPDKRQKRDLRGSVECKEFGEWQYWRQRLPSLEEVERTLKR